MKTKLTSFFRKSILAFTLLLSANSFGQGIIPTVGTDFWMGFMNNYGGSNAELRLFISSSVATSGTVDMPLQGWSQPFVVVPNVVTTVVVPLAMGLHVVNDVVDLRGIHITTLDDVSVFGINFASATADATKVLPVKSLGIDYIVTTYQGIGFNGNNMSSECLVVATEDGTEIQITPSVPTDGGHAAGVPYIVQLDQGESYQVTAADNFTDLTGTFIVGTAASGDCRPFAVFGGVECANIPTGCTYCDHICDQMLPSESWGNEYYTVPFDGPTSYTYTVVARNNGTSVSVNGGAPFILNAGQSQIFNNINTADQIVGSGPISVTQFMQGTSCSGTGDPAMLVLNADDQRISNVTFGTVTSGLINSHNLNLVVETIDVGTVLLDGIAIPVGDFNTYPSNPVNSFASIVITQGSHNLQAPNGFSAYSYGSGNAESYAYSVGSYSVEPPLLVDSALCTNDTVNLSPPNAMFNPEWTTMSDSITIIGTTNTLTLYPPIINDVYIITGSSLISGCEQEYAFSVAVPNPPVIDAVASDDTVCMFNNVQMGVNIATPGSWEYSWAPAYYFDNPDIQSPTLTAMVSGWYYVTVSSIGSTCSSATDSVYVHVDGGNIASVVSSAVNPSICLGDSSLLNFDVTQIAYYDDFNGGIDPNMWNSVVGYQNSNICGSLSGDALFFDGAPNRIAETVDMNVLLGGSIEFSIKIADGVAPCDNANAGENVLLQYSTTGGAPWTTISTLFEYAYPVITAVSIPIPAGAMTASTRFRWIQPTFTAAGEDVWLLENTSIQVLDNTGFTFDWSPSASLNDPLIASPMATPTASTWYVVDVAQGSCLYSDSVLVNTNDFIVDAGQDSILCTTAGFTLNGITSATAPVYTWSNGLYLDDNTIATPTILVDSTLEFILTVDNGVCAVSDTVLMTFVSSAAINIPVDSTICAGQSIALDLGSSSNITWNPTTDILNPTTTLPVFSPSFDTDYHVDYMTPEGCWLSDSMQIYVTQIPVVSLGNDTSVCLGSPVTMVSTSNVVDPQYLWSTGDTIPDITVTAQGTYWLSITTACGVSTDTLVISDFLNFANSLGNDTMLCDGFTLDLVPTVPVGGGVLWSDGSTAPTYTISTSSTVWAEVTDSNGCVALDTITVGYHAITVIDLGPDQDVCEYDTISIDATVPFGDTYLWSNGDPTAETEIMDDGTYFVEVTNIFGCLSTDTVVINEILAPVPEILGPAEYCTKDTVVYNLSQAYNSYLWIGGSDSTSTAAWGGQDQVFVEVVGANNCIGYDTISIQMVPNPFIDLPDQILLCDTALVEVTAFMPGASYLWETGETTASIIVGEGIWSVEAFAVCSAYDSIEVIVGNVDFTLGNDKRICDGQTIFIAPEINNLDSLHWYDGTEGNIFTYADQYDPEDTLMISAMAYGCGDTGDTVLIYVIDCDCPIFVPNTFTPNGDEYNHAFRIAHNCTFEEFEFIIYNRWGETVFESYDDNFVWDGTNGLGKQVQDGTYVWRIRYKNAFDIEMTDVREKTGHINVMR